MNSPGWYDPICHWKSVEKITPEIMKRQSQNKNNTQLWM